MFSGEFHDLGKPHFTGFASIINNTHLVVLRNKVLNIIFFHFLDVTTVQKHMQWVGSAVLQQVPDLREEVYQRNSEPWVQNYCFVSSRLTRTPGQLEVHGCTPKHQPARLDTLTVSPWQ